MDWQADLLVVGFGLLLASLVYVIVHMLINRVKGRDELQGLFVIRLKKRNKNKPEH